MQKKRKQNKTNMNALHLLTFSKFLVDLVESLLLLLLQPVRHAIVAVCLPVFHLGWQGKWRG